MPADSEKGDVLSNLNDSPSAGKSSIQTLNKIEDMAG
jgi:hypothetical protein